MENQPEANFIPSEMSLPQEPLQLSTDPSIDILEVGLGPTNRRRTIIARCDGPHRTEAAPRELRGPLSGRGDRIPPADLNPHGYRFKIRQQAQAPAYAVHAYVGRVRVHLELDVALTADDPRPAESPQQPEVRNFLPRQGQFPNLARVGADIEIADRIHDPLAGQGVVDRAGESEAQAVATVFGHEAAALGVRGFRGSEEVGVAGGEEVRVDDVADFRRQLGEERSESPVVQIGRRRLCDVGIIAWRGWGDDGFDEGSRSENFGDAGRIVAGRVDDAGEPQRVLLVDFDRCRNAGRVYICADW